MSLQDLTDFVRRHRRLVWLCQLAWLPVLAGALAALPGCERAPAQSGPEGEKKVAVTAGHPVADTVTDFEEFTGRVDAANKAAIQAMVPGYLKEINFVDGQEVKAGEVLFEIDPSVYQASFNLASATLKQAKAHYERLDEDFQRNKPLAGKGVVSLEEFNKLTGDRLEAEASIGMATAQLEQANVNLKFTKVTTPFTGKVSRRLIDKGNMVKERDTILTWVYQIDPMYGYFDVDERTVIRLRKLINEGKMISYRDGKLYVDVGLADEETFSMKGEIDWVDNVLDAGTGTLKVRCVIHQPRDANGKPMVLVSPGMFVRVRLPIGAPHPAMLVSEKAIGTDQGVKFVYVVNAKGEAERRTVFPGQMHKGMRVLEDDPAKKVLKLQTTDLIVISGLQRIRPGAKLSVTEATMPRLDAALPGAPPAIAAKQ